MHGWVDSEIPAIVLALIIIVAVSLGFAHQVTTRSKRKLKRNQRLVVEGATTTEAEVQSAAHHKSMLATNSVCAICQNPTTRRCSRCKAVRYCSSECQALHWRESHKKECRAPEASSLSRSGSAGGIMCNGQRLERSRSVDSANLLDSLSPGSSRSDSNNNSGYSNSVGVVDKLSPNQSLKPPCNSITSDGSLPRPKKLLFPYDYFVKLFNWDMLSLPCGLINCGNSCFANVVLQCLTYTRPLTSYLLDGCHGGDCRRNDWCFMCELQSHVWKVRQNQNPFSPIRILSRIRNIGNHLGYGRQEDAHEFMRFAIDSMQSICLDEVGGEKAVDPATQETTLIHHIFGGHLQSQVKCMQCQHESNRYESMMDLAVEIHGVVESLEDAIAQFTTTEMLDGDNKYKCDRCNAYVKARKRLTVHEAPNILTIALKRFQSGKFGKLNKRVTFPEVLDMSPYMSGKGDKPPLYRLYAVVVHVDMLNASFFGHYICYVKDSNGVWYKIDDSKVKEVELDKVMAQRAYMLFYSRSVARKAPTTEGQPAAAASAPSISLKNNGLPVFLEPQRSSIFPPTLGAVPVPTDLSKDYPTDSEPLRLETDVDESEVINEEQMQRSEHIVDALDYGVGKSSLATKATDMGYTSTFMSEEEEELSEEANLYGRTSSYLEAATIPSPTNTDVASTSQMSGSVPSVIFNVEQEALLLDPTNDGPDRGGAKRTHESFSPLPAPRPLDIDQLAVFPSEDHGRSPPSSPVLDFGQASSSSSEWPKGVVDLVSSSLSSVLKNGPAVPSLSSTVAKNESPRSMEADVWKDNPAGRAKRQHTEDDGSGKLGSAGPGVDGGDCQHMEIDEGSEFVESAVNLQRFLEVLPDGCAGPVKPLSIDKHGDGGLSHSSSKALLELESSLCSENAGDHTKEFIEGDGFTSSSIRIPGVGIGPMLAESTSGELFPFASQLSHQGRVLIEELPGPATDIVEPASEEAVVANGPIDLYDEVLMEDDIPYVVVEPISMEQVPGFFDELMSKGEEDAVGQTQEASNSDMHDEAIEEPADGAASNVEPPSQKMSQESGHGQTAIAVPVTDVKPEKQTPKPLFAPGFLNKSPRPSSVKSLNKRTDAHTNGLGGEGGNPAQSNQADPSGRNGRPASARSVTNGAEVDTPQRQATNGKVSSQVTSNGNHSNGKTAPGKKPVEPASESGRENGVSSSLVLDRVAGDGAAGGAKLKQGRNESCACGSQQKWKKCCGKASVLKGGLASKQVVW